MLEKLTCTDPAHKQHPSRKRALISDTILRLREYDVQYVESVWRCAIQLEKEKNDAEAVFRQWYRRAATRDANGERLIVWKRNAEFAPEQLFFRALDTGRLLSMALADFRVQWYACPHIWDYWETVDAGDGILKGAKGAMDFILLNQMQTILVLRNFYDMNAGDVPIIFVDWTDEILERVLDYYVGLSKPAADRNDAALIHEFDDLVLSIREHKGHPCIHEADTLIRALFADPAAEYLPPFIILTPAVGSTFYKTHGKTRVLFRAPDCAPPLALLQSLPKSCGGANCASEHGSHPAKCGRYVWDRLHILDAGSHLVRPHNHLRGTLCNQWGCNKRRGLVQCSRCKEVRYCSTEHQSRDWRLHKRVCEAR